MKKSKLILSTLVTLFLLLTGINTCSPVKNSQAKTYKYGNVMVNTQQKHVPFVKNVKTYLKTKPSKYSQSPEWQKVISRTFNNKVKRYKSIPSTVNKFWISKAFTNVKVSKDITITKINTSLTDPSITDPSITTISTTSSKISVPADINRYHLTSYLYLPTPLGKSGKTKDLANPQGIQIVGNYIYVIYTPGRNKAFINKYNKSCLENLKVTKPENISKFREAGQEFTYQTDVYNSQTTFKDGTYTTDPANGKAVMKCITKRGPLISTGHGQSFAYNPKTNSFWAWKDQATSKHKSVSPKGEGILQEISIGSLKVVNEFKFKIAQGNSKILMGSNLTFDSSGTGYFATRGNTNSGGKNYSNAEKIYKITIDKKKKIKIRQVQNIQYLPNKDGIQSAGYNKVLNKIVIVGEDSIQTIPVSKLKGNKGKVTKGDISYVNYSSKREFEGFTYDDQGYGYLIVNKGPEILRTNYPVQF